MRHQLAKLEEVRTVFTGTFIRTKDGTSINMHFYLVPSFNLPNPSPLKSSYF